MTEQASAMRWPSESTTAADDGSSIGVMASLDRERLQYDTDSLAPSTAESTTETIDSSEEVHYCEEWELFARSDEEQKGSTSTDFATLGVSSRPTSASTSQDHDGSEDGDSTDNGEQQEHSDDGQAVSMLMNAELEVLSSRLNASTSRRHDECEQDVDPEANEGDGEDEQQEESCGSGDDIECDTQRVAAEPRIITNTSSLLEVPWHDDPCAPTTALKKEEPLVLGETMGVELPFHDLSSEGEGEIEQAQDLVNQKDEDAASQTEAPMEDSVRRRIQVVVRVCPPRGSEEKEVVTAGENNGTSLCVQATSAQGSISTVTECSFDRVFMGDATQEDVFTAMEPSVQACLQGFNATVFAYGQTGTGKTHTLFGSELDVFNGSKAGNEAVAEIGEDDSLSAVKSSWGIVPRTLSYLLDQAVALKKDNIQVDLQCSFLQIYNDRLFDLLTDRMRQKPLLIREQPTLDGTTSVSVQGLSSERITTFASAMQTIQRGHTNRCVRETEANLSSSRSHVIVQIHVVTERLGANGTDRLIRKARLNLVDLAGSEKWNTDLEMEEARSQELKNINTSLSALGNCIAALTEVGRRHIPYRDSTLTRVLQDSFGGNTQSCLIATISAAQRASEETIRTLHFADRARSVMQTIRVNEVASGSTELLMAKVQIAKLRERLESEHRKRHETRVKEQQTLQRYFSEKLKAKDKEIAKLTRDNAVFQKWREEDVKKIRALEGRVKELELGLQNDTTKDHEKDQQAMEPAVMIPAKTPKQQTVSPAPASGAKHVALEKTNSRANLSRVIVGRDTGNSSAARTYKQVLERYALGSKNGKRGAIQINRSSSDECPQQESSVNASNQLDNPAFQPSNPGEEEHWKRWETRAAPAPENDCTRMTGQSLGVPLSAPPANNPSGGGTVAAALSSSVPKSAWNYTSQPATLPTKEVNHSGDWLSLVNARSTPAILTHMQTTQESSQHDESRYQRSIPAQTSAARQEHAMMLKNNGGGSSSYGSLPRPSASMVANDTKGSTEPCQKHKLAGCMLCSVTGTSHHQPQAASEYQDPRGPAASKFAKTEAPKVRDVRDGPCQRHQLLCCFICMKNSINSSDNASTNAGLLATTATTTAAFTDNSASIRNTSLTAYPTASNPAGGNLYGTQSHPIQVEPHIKCALHALANCILCAGAKAMTRKIAPPSQASPSKLGAGFTANAEVAVDADERATDRYRRYTLDERLLSYQPPPRTQLPSHQHNSSSSGYQHNSRGAW